MPARRLFSRSSDAEAQGLFGALSDEADDLLIDLVESNGGGWDLIARDTTTVAALDSGEFDLESLCRFAELRALGVLWDALAALDQGSMLLVRG
jgi:hypothetical protein